MVNLSHPIIDDGATEVAAPTPSTLTDSTVNKSVKVLHGETVADIATRIYGANSELNRDRIRANSRDPQPGDTIEVHNV